MCRSTKKYERNEVKPRLRSDEVEHKKRRRQPASDDGWAYDVEVNGTVEK